MPRQVGASTQHHHEEEDNFFGEEGDEVKIDTRLFKHLHSSVNPNPLSDEDESEDDPSIQQNDGRNSRILTTNSSVMLAQSGCATTQPPSVKVSPNSSQEHGHNSASNYSCQRRPRKLAHKLLLDGSQTAIGHFEEVIIKVEHSDVESSDGEQNSECSSSDSEVDIGGKGRLSLSRQVPRKCRAKQVNYTESAPDLKEDSRTKKKKKKNVPRKKKKTNAATDTTPSRKGAGGRPQKYFTDAERRAANTIAARKLKAKQRSEESAEQRELRLARDRANKRARRAREREERAVILEQSHVCIAGESEEQRATRLQRMTEDQRRRIAGESEEQRATRLQRMTEDQRRRIAGESEEQRATRLQRMAEDQRMRIGKETEEQRSARIRRGVEYNRKRIAGETEEQRAARIKRCVEYNRKRMAGETEEQRAARIKRGVEYNRKRMAGETEEQRAARIKRDVEYKRKRIAAETDEERAARLARIRRYNANSRDRRFRIIANETEEQRIERIQREAQEQREKKRVSMYMHKVARMYELGEEEVQRLNKIKVAKAKEWRKNLAPEKKKRYNESVKRSLQKYYKKLKDPVKRKERLDKYKNECPEKRHRRLYRYKIGQARNRLKKRLEHEGASVEIIKQKMKELGEEMWANMPPFTADNVISEYKPRPRKSSQPPTIPPAVEVVMSQPCNDDFFHSSLNRNFSFHQTLYSDTTIRKDVSWDAAGFSHPNIPSENYHKSKTTTNSMAVVESVENTNPSMARPRQLLKADDLSSSVSATTSSMLHETYPAHNPVEEYSLNDTNDADDCYASDSDYVPPDSPPSQESSGPCSPSLQTLNLPTIDLKPCVSVQQTLSPATATSNLTSQPSNDKKTDQSETNNDSTPPRKSSRRNDRGMCDECGKEFGQISYHKKRMHNPNLVLAKCPRCPMEFKHSGGLWHHFSKFHLSETSADPTVQASQLTKTEYIDNESGKNNFKASDAQRFSNRVSPVCDKTLESSEKVDCHSFKKHETGSRKDKNVCFQCGKSYKQLAALTAHIRQVHDGQHFRCDICNRDCQSEGKLWRHKVEYHKMRDLCAPKSLIVCEFCGGNILRGYEIHVRKEHPDKIEQFLLRSPATALVRELGIEGSKSVVQCPKCHKEIIRSSLKKHLRNVHKIGELTSFPCPVCSREFKEKYHLNEHMNKVHDPILEKINDNKLFHYVSQEENITTVCRICGESWGQNFEVRTHIVTQHSDIYLMLKMNESIPYKCKECHKQSSTENELREHMEAAHSEQCEKCPKCSKVMVYWFEKEHHLTHGCGSTLITTGVGNARRELGSSLTNKFSRSLETARGKNIVQCTECSKEISRGSLVRHLRTVHGIGTLQSFPCPTCHKEFKETYELSRHIKSVHEKSDGKKKRKLGTKVEKRKSSRVRKFKKSTVSDTEDVEMIDDIVTVKSERYEDAKICALKGITKTVKIHLVKLTTQDIRRYTQSNV